MSQRSVAKALLATYVALIFTPNLTLIVRDPGIVPLVRGLLVSGLLFATVFSLLRLRLWIACALFLPFALLAPAETYFIARYGRPSDANIVATVFESNLREASSYLGSSSTLYLAISIAFTGILSVLAIVHIRRKGLMWRHRSADWIAGITIGVPIFSLLLAIWTGRDSTHPVSERAWRAVERLGIETYATFPFGVIGRFVEYRTEWSAMRKAAQDTAGFRFGAHAVSPIERRQIYVLVIGEASRRDHWSLFGYDRDTNPELARTANLVPIKNMISPWGASRWAVPVIVTRKPETDWSPYYHEPSISKVFGEAGFHTYWYSTQMAVGLYDSPISVAAFDASTVQFYNPAGFSNDIVTDDALLQPLRELIMNGGDSFVVLHTMGSHQDYAARYPPAYDRFRPSLKTGPQGSVDEWERIRNTYDNSVLFTDHILRSVIDLLVGSDSIAAMFYVADHGEMLPDATCSAAGHAFSGLPVYTIPALFWYSDAYARKFPEKVAEVRANSSQPLSTGDLFESLVEMGNVDFADHDSGKSVFNPRWTAHQRIVHANTTVDFDRKAVLPGCGVIVPE